MIPLFVSKHTHIKKASDFIPWLLIGLMDFMSIMINRFLLLSKHVLIRWSGKYDNKMPLMFVLIRIFMCL